MTTRVGPKGQVVIPKQIRDRVSLEPGDEVDIELRGDDIVVTARRHARVLGGRFRRSGMADRLLADRASEPR
jgi:AbrB family looped-hinge helix DNA binding protein